MSALDRTLAGTVLGFDLAAEIESVRNSQPGNADRTARTLVKEGPLRVTLIAMTAGGEIAEHAAEGPITIQVLEGAIQLRLEDDAMLIGAGHIVAVPARQRHSVTAPGNAAFLLTVVMPGSGA